MSSRKCGDFPWERKWFVRQSRKAPRYFCLNCLKTFRTGKFSRFDSRFYDDVCPNCGGIGSTLEEVAEAYKDLLAEVDRHERS